MQYQDYYQTLGIEKTASDDEIKKAYRKLAKKFHPDQNHGDKAAEEKFKEINEAYEVLKDKEKRARYDQLGSSYKEWQQNGGNSSNYNWNDWFSGAGRQQSGGTHYYTSEDFSGMGGGQFSDFFSQIFGGMDGGGFGGRQRSTRTVEYDSPFRQSRPSVQEHNVAITLDEAFHGTKRLLQINNKKIEAVIPAGAKSGTKVRLAGVIEQDGRKSDLILVIQVADKDALFERQGNDLYVNVPVDLYTAVLGGEVVFASMDGNIGLKIPAGTQPGQLIRLGGKGMPKLNGKGLRGDLFARINVQIPRKLDEKQKKLFKELQKT